MTPALPYTFELRPLHGDFGVEALGIDIAQPLAPAVADALREAFGRHRLLVIRGQSLSPAAHIAFTRQFGEPEVHVLNEYHKAEHPEIFELSNIGPDGKPNAVHPDLGTLFWHSDGSFQKLPALATLLYAEQAPASGGHTLLPHHICTAMCGFQRSPILCVVTWRTRWISVALVFSTNGSHDVHGMPLRSRGAFWRWTFTASLPVPHGRP